ncbi:MAG: carbonic anhydrase [Kordiimonadaceae bacterium]|nr:carbonic anhydrase [Kordiimonadaceae bacterium]
MNKVKDGVARFNKDIYPRHRELFERLSQGQDPEVLFITCSDSRIDTNLITQTQPGDLFIVRNAGNIVPPHSPGSSDVGTVASIEFAVGALKTQEIIVCGHTDCGAMKGALNPEMLEGLPHVCDWLKHSHAALQITKDHHSNLTKTDKLNKLIEENVISQLTHLRTYPFIASQLRAKKVNLHGWVYDIRSGQITEYNEETGQFEPLSASAALKIQPNTTAA